MINDNIDKLDSASQPAILLSRDEWHHLKVTDASGNERDRISQLLLVVKADRGDDGKCAVTDVCAVKPSAEANLDHIDV